MDKVKINMVGGGFQHDICSSSGSTPKYVEGIKGNHTANISIHVDNAIMQPTNKMKKSYAFTTSETELLYYTIGEHLEETVTKYPETEALVATWRNERYTYREFHDIYRRAAKGFMKLGVAKGDRVAIWATNYPEWVITQFATAMIGAILVTVNPAYRSHELDYCIGDSQSQTLLLIGSYKTSDYLSMFY